MDPNPDTTVLHDELYQAIDSVTVAAVVRLAVHAIVGAGGVFDETADDNAVAQGDTLLEVLNLPYVNNGTGWIRAQGGTDNASAGTANQGQFVGGIVTDPLDAFADGDFSLLHFDTNGRLLVNAEGVTDTDDDAIAAGQETSLGINLNYGYDGTDWGRMRIKSAAAATSDERLAHLSTMAVLAMIDTTAPAGSMEIPIAANRNVGAAMSETAYFLPTRSAVTGIDASAVAGSQNVPVAARNADVDGDYLATLVGLLTNARVCNWNPDTGAWERGTVLRWDSYEDQANTYQALLTGSLTLGLNSFSADLQIIESRAAVTAQAYTLNRLLTDTVVRGDNGTTYSAVAARDFDANADVAATLVGLVTNSRMAVINNATSDWARWVGELVGSVSGRVATTIFAAYTNSVTVGIDNTGAAVLRPVEARTGVSAGYAYTLYGLLTNSRIAGYNAISGDWGILTSHNAVSVAGSTSEGALALSVAQARADEFAAARRGKRFYGTHQTPGTLITAQTSFVATTPTLMYRINSAAIRAIIRSINISVANTPGGVVYVTLAIDTADRWSAGGTLVTLQNSNEESATAAVGLFYTNPTATAAGGGTRYLGTWIVPASAAANYDVDVADGILLGPTASTLLVYVWSATTAADLVFTVDLEEVA